MHPRQLYTAASKYRLQSSVLLVALIYFSVGGSVFAAEEVAPSPPQLVSPAEGALTTGNTDPPVGVPTLRWKASSGATRYHVQISSSAGFASPADESNTTALAYTPRVALADGTYYWRVRAGTMLEWGSYSQSRSFVKDWGASGTLQPTLLAPDAGAVRICLWLKHEDAASIVCLGGRANLLRRSLLTPIRKVKPSEPPEEGLLPSRFNAAPPGRLLWRSPHAGAFRDDTTEPPRRCTWSPLNPARRPSS